MGKGKRTIAVNLKHERGRDLIRKLSKSADVLIEPYRPGVMENLSLGPDALLRENPRLIYARLSGYGQTGPLAKRAGHDINYVALSGILSMLGRHGEPPQAPINIIADFAGGGLLCALGICVALLERHRSGKGQIIDCSMSEGAAYVGSWLTQSQNLPIWGQERGKNLLDGGTFFYNTYETKDGKYMSVGALEPQFFAIFAKTLGLGDVNQFDEDTDGLTKRVQELFRAKTQEEWTKLFEHTDSCVYPVLDWKEAHLYQHNKERGAFVDQAKTDGMVVAAPAPKLSRTPAVSRVLRCGDYVTEAQDIFKELNLSNEEVRSLCDDGVVILPTDAKL